MRWLKIVIVMTVLCVVFGKDTDEDEILQENDRDNREIDQEGWRAVEVFQESNAGWIPHDQSEEQIPKRRRLKKRKRRPPMFSLTDEFNSDKSAPERVLPQRRRVRPQRLQQRLEQIREPWAEMTEDAIRRPNIRRRVTPTYQSSEEIIFSDEHTNISPMDAVIRFEEETPDNKEEQLNPIQVFYDNNKNENEDGVVQTPAVSDLKTVLKQTGGGVSLSEILQQKNLSLTELLRGNQEAISALTEKPQELTEPAVDIKTTEFEIESTKYKRLPPSIGLRKNINRQYEQQGESLEGLSTKEMLEAQRKRLALLHGKDSKLFSSVTKYDVVTEPTTDRRIFVPSHPKYYTSLNYRPDFNIYNEQSTEPLPQTTIRDEIITTPTTTTLTAVQTTKGMHLKSKLKRLPITNAKINKLIPKTTFKPDEMEEENYPIRFHFPKPMKININDIFGFQADQTKNIIENKDEPLRVSIDINNFTEYTTMNAELENYSYHKTTLEAKEPETTTEPLIEKVTYVTAKDEIIEILKDPISRENLARILENRNMTVQELVEQRERGSSQLHLADIFHNKTREPEPKEEPYIGHINSEHFNNFSILGRKQKSITFDEQHSNQYSTTLNILPTETVTKVTEKTTRTPKEAYSITSFPTVKIEANRNLEEKTNPFIWKELYPELFAEVHGNSYKMPDNPFQFSRGSFSEEDIQRLEDIDSALSLASQEKRNVHENGFEEEVLLNIPSGVRSAIFVSLAIIGLSIIVFSTILLVFRWTQRQKRKLNYCNSLSSKIKSPIIIQRRPMNAIKSFMNETLGRKKNYYKSNVQSMSDDMWESSRDRRPSF